MIEATPAPVGRTAPSYRRYTPRVLVFFSVVLFPLSALAQVPSIENWTPSNITSTSAHMYGSLTSTGTAPTEVWVYWSTNDYGTTKAAWGTFEYLGLRDVGQLYTNVTGLTPSTMYWYRYYASNVNGDAWAPSSTNFTTDATVLPEMRQVQGGGQPGGPEYTFYMGKFEVSNEEFVPFLNDAKANQDNERGTNLHFAANGNIYYLPGEMPTQMVFGVTNLWSAGIQTGVRYTNGQYEVVSGRENHPVIGVSHFGAIKYCNWLTIESGRGVGERCYAEGDTVDSWRPITATNWPDFTDAQRQEWVDNYQGYRLPMDDHWGANATYNEFFKAAAWDGTGNRMYGFGRDSLANVDCNYNVEDWTNNTTPVGYYNGTNTTTNGITLTAANSNYFGIYDLSGNVGEWCSDTMTTNVLLNISMRGGDWNKAPVQVQANSKSGTVAGNANDYTGLRLVSTFEPSLPIVSNLDGATNITTTSAELYGDLISTGTASTWVSIFWGTNDGGRVKSAWGDEKYFGFQGPGAFVTNIMTLTPGTVYFYRCYASNVNGHVWSPTTTNFITGAVVPTLSTPTHSAIDTNTATLGATLDSDGGAAIIERGTVWDVTPNPTGNAVAEGGTGLGDFSHGRSGLPAGTRIYYRGYATNSAGTGYSIDGDFYTEPGTQPSGVSFTNVGDTNMRITWTNGSGAGRIVVVKQGSAVDSDPVDGTEHTANSVFGSGEQLGGANYVVYRGAGTQVDVTGLTPLTTYHVAVYEYVGGGGLVNYRQIAPAVGNQATTSAGPQILRVDWTATGANDGTTWANAFTNLQDALSTAVSNDQIWVAAGTYVPTNGTNRSASFELKEWVGLYGGFAGGESSVTQRNWEASFTVLSGDLLGDDNGHSNTLDNSHHVVRGTNNAVLDGFIIQGGHADDIPLNQRGGGMFNVNSSPKVQNCTFILNRGIEGGAVCNEYGTPEFINCAFLNNWADGMSSGQGGGMYNHISTAIISNCVFAGNTVHDWGGAVDVYQGHPQIINCLIAGNMAPGSGGGLRIQQGQATVRNSTIANNECTANGPGICNDISSDLLLENTIVWGNTGAAQQIDNNVATCAVSWCDIEGGITNIINGTLLTNGVNLQQDPKFVGGAASTWTSDGSYNSNLKQTILMDSGSAWNPNQLAGKFIQPNTNEPFQYLVVSNLSPVIFVWGDATALGTVSNGYTYKVHDYHLESTAGHWESGLGTWSNDVASSPCIDAGNPAASGANEPPPNGGRINIGAYGNTPEASKTSAGAPPVINNNGGASGITDVAATLNGNLVSTGGAPTEVYIMWGTNDEDTVLGGWENTSYFGYVEVGSFFTNIFGLSSNTTYYYRCYATNAYGEAWAPTTTNFVTNPDADADGMDDAWEIAQFGNTTTADASTDWDGDGLRDLLEFQNGTDPKVQDTDTDGFSDYIEVINNANPTNVASFPAYPYKEWTRIWGSAADDYGIGASVNPLGGIYVAGFSEGSFDGQANWGGRDLCLTQYGWDGTKLWTRIWGSNANDEASGRCAGSTSGVYAAGAAGSSFDGQTNAGSADICLSKYTENGTKLWTRIWGSGGIDAGTAVDLDSLENVYVTAGTWGSFDGQTNSGSDDLCLTKYAPDGTKLWTRIWGSSGSESPSGISVDPYDNVYVAAHTFSAFDGQTNAGGADACLTKYSSDGTKLWTRIWGSSNEERGFAVDTDSSGNAYLTGNTYGGFDGQTNANPGTWDLYLTKYSPDGIKLWTRIWGSTANESARSVIIDSADNVYVAGYTAGSFDGQTNAGGASDLFFTKFSQDGTKEWTRIWGSVDEDLAFGLAADSGGIIYVAGYTDGSFDCQTNAGLKDMCLTKWIDPPTLSIKNLDAIDITTTSATLRGDLQSTGPQTNQADVVIYWGLADGETNALAWECTNFFGLLGPGPFQTNLTGLLSDTQYFYRCYASNTFGGAWAPGTTNFMTMPAGVPSVELLKPQNYAEFVAFSWTDPTNAFDLPGIPGDESTQTAYLLSTNATDNIDFSQWTPPIRVHTQLTLSVKWSTDGIFTDDSFYFDYTTNGGLGWNVLLSAGTYTDMAWQVASTPLDPNTDHGLLQVRVGTAITSGQDGGMIYISDVYTEGMYDPGALAIVNQGPSGITDTEALFNGYLSSTGTAPTEVYLYWGASDGATNAAAWQNTNYFGYCNEGAIFTNITGLAPGTNYFYRYYATNDNAQTRWAPVSEMFFTSGGVGGGVDFFKVYGIPSPLFTNQVINEIYVEAYKGTNVWTNYTGTITFSSSTPGSFPANYSFQLADNGVHVFSNDASFMQAGDDVVLSVSDTNNPSMRGDHLSIVVLNGYGTQFSRLVMTMIPEPVTTGQWITVGIGAVDQNWNLATNYVGTVDFSSSDGSAWLPLGGAASYTLSPGDDGWHTFSNDLQFNTVGEHWLMAQDSVNSNVIAQLWNVTVQDTIVDTNLDHFVIEIPHNVITGEWHGVGFEARSISEHTVDWFTGTLVVTNSDPLAAHPTNVVFSGGDNGAKFLADSVQFWTIGTQSMSCYWQSDSNKNGLVNDIQVTDGAAPGIASFNMELMQPVAMVNEWLTFSLTALDDDGNVLSNYAGNVDFMYGDPGATGPSSFAFTGAEGGVSVFTNQLSFANAGSWEVRAEQQGTPEISGDYHVRAFMGGATGTTHFLVEMMPRPAVYGMWHDVLVVAMGDGDQVNTNHIDQVNFSSSDGSVTWNTDPFSDFSNGWALVTNQVQFWTVGEQTLGAYDTVTPSITGQTDVLVLGGGTVYYVNDKSGSDTYDGFGPASAWKTINYAVGQIGAGDVVLVGAGTYNESVAISLTGTSNALYSFIGDYSGRFWKNDEVEVTGGGMGPAFDVMTASHIAISGFDSVTPVSSTGIVVSSCTDIKLIGIDIQDKFLGIRVDTSQRVKIKDVDIQNCAEHGILATASSHDLTVHGSRIQQCGQGIRVTLSTNTTVADTMIQSPGDLIYFDFGNGTIAGNYLRDSGSYAITINGANSRADIVNNVLLNNTGGGGIWLSNADPGCSVMNNTCVSNESALIVINSDGATVRNNIMAYNPANGITVDTASTNNWTASHNNCFGNGTDWQGVGPGTGSTSNDPQFVSITSGSEDFHLKSTYGHWSENGWVYDGSDSPCIDAGYSASPWDDETEPNGGRINMGAYGNTPQASRSAVPDADGDGMPDAWEIQHFGTTNALPSADNDADGLDNVGEYIADTIPTNAQSVLMIVDTTIFGGDPRIYWLSSSNRNYDIEGSTNLVDWGTVASDQTATPPTNFYTHSPLQSESTYYRILTDDGISTSQAVSVNIAAFHWLNLATNGNGSVDVPVGWVQEMTNLVLTATPSNNYHFLDWTGDIASTTNPLTLGMTQAWNIVVNFELDQHELVVGSDYGAPYPAVGTNLFYYGSSVTCEVSSPVPVGSETQYVCVGWMGSGSVPISGSTTNTGPHVPHLFRHPLRHLLAGPFNPVCG